MRIEYLRGKPPDIFVENPDIQVLAGERKLPHVYHNPLRLCLYLPSSGQWKPSKRLDQTIVPWTAIWLYYFEEWLVSNDWKGGGKHPSDEPDEALSRQLRRMRV
ncbi:MAG TPA: hypothetical protein VIL84_04955 [Devosiaceae bacterium]